MEMKSLLEKITSLQEATKKTPTGLIHKAEPGGYGRKYDTDEEGDESSDGEKDAAKAIEKRGRGRPKKAGGEADTKDKYSNAKSVQDLVVGTLPKGKLPGKPGKKHSLKEYFEALDQALNEAEQVTIQPAKQNTQVIKQGNKVLGSVENPALANTIKQAIGKGEMSLAGDTVQEAEQWIKGAIKDPGAFTAKAKRHGMTAKEFARHVLANKDKFPAKTEKQANLLKTLSKFDEADMPPNDSLASPLTLEAKEKTVKRDDRAEKAGKKVAKDIEYDEKVKDKIHGKKRDAEDDKAEKAGKKVAKDIEYDEKKKKKTVKEGMSHRLHAAKLEGKAHGLKGHAYHGKAFEDLEEARAYHEGYKEGLDECYGMSNPVMGEESGQDVVDNMASYGAEEGDLAEMDEAVKIMRKDPFTGDFERYVRGATVPGAQAHRDKTAAAMKDFRKQTGIHGANPLKGSSTAKAAGLNVHPNVPFNLPTMEDDLDEMNKTEYMKHKAKTTPGDTFKAFGQTFKDKEVLEMDHMAFESLDKQLNDLLNEGLSVNMSQGLGGPGAEDTVSVTAQGDDAGKLLQFIKQVGLGGFGDEPQASDYGAPVHTAKEVDVVDDHDGMMALIKKMSGNGQDYADEESVEVCGECGGGMYEGHSCGSKEMVDEVESEDQMAYEVAEANLPDSDAAETTADENAEAEEDKALAQATQQDKTTTFNEGGDGGEASEEPIMSEEDEDEKQHDGLDESLANGADDTFEADIDFMTKVISSGLNGQKSTGQTTIPVIPGQKSRMGADGMNEGADSVLDWKKLAGIK